MERFNESRGVMIRSWTSDAPWSHRGRYWQFEGVVVDRRLSGRAHVCCAAGALAA
jgi:hypothetical protein